MCHARAIIGLMGRRVSTGDRRCARSVPVGGVQCNTSGAGKLLSNGKVTQHRRQVRERKMSLGKLVWQRAVTRLVNEKVLRRISLFRLLSVLLVRADHHSAALRGLALGCVTMQWRCLWWKSCAMAKRRIGASSGGGRTGGTRPNHNRRAASVRV